MASPALTSASWALHAVELYLLQWSHSGLCQKFMKSESRIFWGDLPYSFKSNITAVARHSLALYIFTKVYDFKYRSVSLLFKVKAEILEVLLILLFSDSAGTVRAVHAWRRNLVLLRKREKWIVLTEKCQ